MSTKPIIGSQVTRQGTVVSTKMDKTVLVKVERKFQHPLYQKTMKHVKKFKAHDEKGRCKVGDIVEIAECRPLSRDKNWIVTRIVTPSTTI